MRPITTEHEGITVVRDDLFPGGTKARFIPALFRDADEVVYGSPVEGGAQTALATVAKQLGKRATVFVAKRAQPHPRVLLSKALGAQIVQVAPGYLSVVNARAAAYAEAAGARLAPFGMDLPEAVDCIAAAAQALELAPDEVWCASGSGTLARGLAKAWPKARRHVVQVGRALSLLEVAGAEIHVHPLAFGTMCKSSPPFPSDLNYDAKAWEICREKHGSGLVVMWNVTGAA